MKKNSSKTTNTNNLIFGTLRPATGIGRMTTALVAAKGKLIPFRKLDKLVGDADLTNRLGRLGRLVKAKKIGKLVKEDEGARLILKRSAA